MSKQTAVEWLFKLSKERELDKFDLEEAKEEFYIQAMAMEKEQIIKAVLDGYRSHPYMADNGIPQKDGIIFGTTTGEQYYNETYKKS